MKIFSIVTSLILICSGSLFAQTKTFKWDSVLCGYEGTYDSSKYTETQLKNTQELMASIGSISLFTDATAGKPDEVQNLSVEKLEKEYREKSSRLKSLELVRSDFWENIRQRKLKEIEQWYELKKITIQAYQNPALLKNFKQAEFCLNFYAEPLIQGGDYLAATWLKVNMDSRSKNASPQRLKGIFDSQNISPERLQYARVEVMRFGWWNCAIRALDMIDSPDEFLEIEKNFKGLFKSIKEECDEP
jgi:hypothetical protein